jgi:hypothetical protein
MADTVSTKVLLNTRKRLVLQFLNLSDGTGESSVVKVDKSTYTGVSGTEPDHFIVKTIQYACNGMDVDLSFDRTTDVVIARLSGLGFNDYTIGGGFGFVDSTTGDTGDILLTTRNHTSGDSYDIIIELEKAG